jgi:membrane protease YdiL (CAAX protease family)
MSVAPTEPQESAPPEPPVDSTLRWVFIGPNGIRAGWSILIFVALFAAIGATLRFILTHIPGVPRGQSAGAVALGETLIVFITLAATWVMARIEGRSVLDYGLRDRAWRRRFVVGALWGFVLISGLVGLLHVAGYLSFDGQLLHGSTILVDALELGYGFLMVGLAEELSVRGYLQSTLARGIGFWPAAVLLSIVFGLLHLQNPGEGRFGALSAGLAGLVFCFVLYRTGSLWWSIGAHTAWDWGQSYFYGVPDSGLMVPGHLMATHPMGPSWLSGGTVGPEGSIFVLVAFGAIVPIIALTTRASGTTPPPLAPQSRFAPPAA